MKNQTDIFISYRRDGGDMTAMYIFQALKDRGYDVFYDVEVLRSGKFNEALLEYIQSCKDFILVLSPHALDRCEDENDWVRQEIAAAIRENKNIIPIMMNGFQFPEKLPEEIESVRYHTGLTSSTEYFQESMNRLCEKFLTAKPKKKIKRMLPAACILAAAILAAAFFLRGSPAAPVSASAPTPSAATAPAVSPVPSSSTEETETEGVTEAGTDQNAEEDPAHTVHCDVPVFPESMEDISIMSDDWLFSMPYEGPWTLEYVNGIDLDATITNGEFYIGRFPRQEGTTEYRASRYGTDYRILLQSVKPAKLPEHAVLLDAEGNDLDEQHVTVQAGETIKTECHFVPESWTFRDQPQEAMIWIEQGDCEENAFEWECEGTGGWLKISTPGEYKIGVKVNSAAAVAYRFFYLTVTE